MQAGSERNSDRSVPVICPLSAGRGLAQAFGALADDVYRPAGHRLLLCALPVDKQDSTTAARLRDAGINLKP